MKTRERGKARGLDILSLIENSDEREKEMFG